MTTIRCSTDTPLSEARVRAALTDFSARRPDVWPNLDPGLYQVHDRGPSWADVTEGSRFVGGIWERARYDWADPHRVRLTVTASNAFAPGSSWEYATTSRPTGGTHVELVVNRRGRSVKERLLATMLRVGGRKVFCGDLAKALRALEKTGPSAVGMPATQGGEAWPCPVVPGSAARSWRQQRPPSFLAGSWPVPPSWAWPVPRSPPAWPCAPGRQPLRPRRVTPHPTGGAHDPRQADDLCGAALAGVRSEVSYL
jgi:hypothetical protein